MRKLLARFSQCSSDGLFICQPWMRAWQILMITVVADQADVEFSVCLFSDSVLQESSRIKSVAYCANNSIKLHCPRDCLIFIEWGQSVNRLSHSIIRLPFRYADANFATASGFWDSTSQSTRKLANPGSPGNLNSALDLLWLCSSVG